MRVPTFPPKATPPCVLCSAASIISLSPGLVAENNMKSKQQHIFLALFLSCFLVVLFCIGFGQGSALSDNLFEANLNKKWDSTPLKTLKLSVELCQVSSQSYMIYLPYSNPWIIICNKFLWNKYISRKKFKNIIHILHAFF